MLPGWTRYKVQSSGFVPCKPCTLHYYVRNLGKEGGGGGSCQGVWGTTSRPVVLLANPAHYIVM